MSRKSTTPPTTRRRRRQSPKSLLDPSVSISFTLQELQFLTQALRDMPVSGKPDALSQMLPLIQNVRLKLASAFQAAGVAAGVPLSEEAPAE